MDARQRKAWAEQLLANPLFGSLLDKLEQESAERCFHPNATDEQRAEAAFYVRASRSFRQDCERYASNNPPRKAVP